MKKIAVILSGCGVFDGSEIGESMMALLAIDLYGASYSIFAPDKAQAVVMNHLTGEPMAEQRNVLVEAARIARGEIAPLSSFRADEFDALILPGGFGAAKNLSTYATDGERMTVDGEVRQAVLAMHAAGKPIGAMCIAPVILAHLLPGVKLTIGKDPRTAAHIAAMGGVHEATDAAQVSADAAHKVYTTPCYMLNGVRIGQIFQSAQALVKAMLA
ncbi:MAG: isoprenoid biosynthesis glyoxalase ElbB [Bacteroidales bacterium]|nr:isoprenoid biosynthesis glyoxalase ElbB [Bacteroidales bacterium]